MELTFGEQIKIILKRKNMTIRQLAELVEVQTGRPMSRQNLTQKLNRDNFQEQDMKEIAQALGCAVQISVIDPAEAVSSGPNAVAPSSAEPAPERRPARERTAGAAAKLAKKEAAVTRQPAFGEPEEKRAGEPEEDMLAWARKKPLVWPTLTVPTMAVKEPEPEKLPFADDLFSEPEDLGDSAFWEEASVTEAEPENLAEAQEPENMESPKGPEESEGAESREGPGESEGAESREDPAESEDVESQEDLEESEDLEFFDLEDFYGEEVSQAYVIRREETLPPQEASGLTEPPREEPPVQGNIWENQSFDRIPEGGGDVSFASAPYVIPRREEDAEKKPEEQVEDSGEASPSGSREPGSFAGSKGDISSVSAPYVIPREPEEPEAAVEENRYRQEKKPVEDSGEPGEPALEEEPGEDGEEEALSPDMEKKIASWDAAVKRRLENPFLRALEGRARRGGKRAEPEDGESGVRKSEEDGQAVPAEAGEQENRTERQEEETLDLQGPAIDPVTGKEYETNTVKHHPTQPDMLLVYDQDEHRWIVQAERAFLNFQINKRALLGKDYEPPVYLD